MVVVTGTVQWANGHTVFLGVKKTVGDHVSIDNHLGTEGRARVYKWLDEQFGKDIAGRWHTVQAGSRTGIFFRDLADATLMRLMFS